MLIILCAMQKEAIVNQRYINIGKVVIDCIDWCLEQEEIPGAKEEECGNYKSHDLKEAKKWLAKYKEVLTYGK